MISISTVTIENGQAIGCGRSPSRAARHISGLSRTATGFTLIELLVVVAIIALLIAILAPSLAEARRQAKNTLCLSNLHQMAIGCSAYAATTKKGVYPDWWAIGGSSYRVLPGFIEPRSRKVETLGLPAVFNAQRIMPGKSKIWLCPLNEKDAEYGNTYWVNINDNVTQHPMNYDAGTRAIWITDNWNLRPYAPAGSRNTDKGIDGQGTNAKFFREETYWHRAVSSRWRGSGQEGVLTHGWGINVIHLDLSAGFLARKK